MPVPPDLQREVLSYCMNHMTVGGALNLGTSNSKAAAGGNMAFIEVRLNDQVVFREHAFSNSSSLGKFPKAHVAPSVTPNQFGTVGIPNGNQHANHIEPKLWQVFRAKWNSKMSFDTIFLVSELNCCSSCVEHTIKAINGLTGMLRTNFYVVEINSNRVREGHEVN